MKLSRYLEKHNITQAEFAKRIGKSQQLVSAYCTGALIPPRDTAAKIVRATKEEVTLADLWPGVKVA